MIRTNLGKALLGTVFVTLCLVTCLKAYQKGYLQSPAILHAKLLAKVDYLEREREYWTQVIADFPYAPRLWLQQFRGQGELNRSLAYPWVHHRRVAHALGEVKDRNYTNSLEAFETNYRRGFRIFEFDITQSADGHLIAKHDWLAEHKVQTYREFMGPSQSTGLTPLDVHKVLELLNKHPDVSLVTDTKGDFSTLIAGLVAEAQSINPSLLERIIPQIYSEADLIKLEKIHPFKSIILTLYRSRASDQAIVSFASRNHIGVVTMDQGRFTPQFCAALGKKGIMTFVHTVNDPAKANRLFAAGAFGLYTDRLAER